MRFPENTLASIAAAIDAGASHIEIDIQLSADRVPVLFHDRGMGRLCGQSGYIHKHTVEQLRRLKVFLDQADDDDPEPISTLQEVSGYVGRHPQVHIFVELKRISIDHFGLHAVLDQVARVLRPIEGQCIIISSSPDILIEARQQGWQTGFILKHWQERNQSIVKEVRPQYLFCDIDMLPESGSLEINGMKLAIYDVTRPALAQELGHRGAHFVETFAIGEMLAAQAAAKG